MKREFLEAFGLEKEVVDQILDENSKDIGREKQKSEQAKSDLTAAQEQLSQRDKDLAELKAAAGDAETLKKQMEELQEKYTTETGQYKAKLAERDYADAVTRAIAEKGVKFTSKGAGEAFISKLKASPLAIKDGALEGFDAFLNAQKESDPDAFQSDKPIPKFVTPTGAGGPPSNGNKGAEFAKMFNSQYTKT